MSAKAVRISHAKAITRSDESLKICARRSWGLRIEFIQQTCIRPQHDKSTERDHYVEIK
jgi:hypothetical protein